MRKGEEENGGQEVRRRKKRKNEDEGKKDQDIEGKRPRSQLVAKEEKEAGFLDFSSFHAAT